MTAKTISSPYGYLPHVDGLRGLAVMAILLFHLDIPFFQGGFVGVDIFFVISGFLITAIITARLDHGTFSFAEFYAHRIRRIFPALFTMLFLTGIAAFFLLGIDPFTEFFEAMRKAAAQISNFYYAKDTDYFDTDHAHSPLLHTWSLGVEEQFYLLWPLLLFLLNKWVGKKFYVPVLAGLALCSLGLSEYLVRTDASQAFYMLHSRAWELALGGLIALRALPECTNRNRADFCAFTGLGMMIYAIIFYDPAFFPGLKALIPCGGAALFIHGTMHKNGIIGRFFSMKMVTFTGQISYSLYLWHWPLIAFYTNYFAAGPDMTAKIIMFILSYIFATLSYFLIETPSRRITMASKILIPGAMSMIALFVLTGNIAKRQSDAHWRVTYDAPEFVRKPHELDRICSVEGGAYDKELCLVGHNKKNYEVILVGDSHASHYTPAVLGWAEKHGLSVRLFMRGACPAWVTEKDARYRHGKKDDYCMNLMHDFYKTLETDHAIQYVFLGRVMPSVDADTKKSLEKLNASGKKIIYLGKVPVFRENPHYCRSRKNLLLTYWIPNGEDHCMEIDLSYSNQKLAHKITTFKTLLQAYNIYYFDPLPYMLSAFDSQGRFMYLDDNHMNRYGGRHLAEPLSNFMDTLDKKKK